MAKELDPWLLNPDGSKDPFASNVNWDMPDLPDLEDDQPNIDPVLQSALDPETISSQPVADPVPDPVVEPDEPKVMELPDGTQLTFSKEKGWWVGSVVGPAGSPQKYKGATKDDLIFEVLKAQANATQKIREQNRELKLGKTPPPAQPQETAKPSNSRELTADERFEIKTLWESDPAAAFDLLLKKTRGVTIDDILNDTKEARQKGSYASNQLLAEQANKGFLTNNPDYYPHDKNIELIIKWLAKYKLGKTATEQNANQIFEELVSTGNYTAETLEEAFKDLNDDDLLVRAPVAPITHSPATVEPPPPVADSTPVPAPRPDSRIVKTETRPRAALGIRPADVTPVREPNSPKAPSAEDFESMTDKEIDDQIAAVRMYRAKQNRRSN